jgi:hypothetical protein
MYILNFCRLLIGSRVNRGVREKVTFYRGNKVAKTQSYDV